MFLINCLRVNSEIGSAEHDASNLLRRKTDRQTSLSVSLFSLSDSLSPLIPRKRESEKMPSLVHYCVEMFRVAVWFELSVN